MRIRFRYGLGSLLLAVTVCALGCGWLAGEIDRYRRVARKIPEWQGRRITVGRSPAAPRWFFEPCEKLFAMPFVEVDVVQGNALSDEDAAFVATHCPALRVYTAERDLTTDVGLARLATLPRVEWLAIGAKRDTLTSDGIRSILRMRRLRRLVISGSALSDGDIVSLVDLKELQHLSIRHTPATAAALVPFAERGKLRSLVIGDRMGDEALRVVARMATLEELYLQSSPITSEGLYALQDLPRLHTIEFWNVWLGDDAVGMVKAISALRTCRAYHPNDEVEQRATRIQRILDRRQQRQRERLPEYLEFP